MGAMESIETTDSDATINLPASNNPRLDDFVQRGSSSSNNSKPTPSSLKSGGYSLALKCVLLGNLGVGKSSIVNRLLHNTFEAHHQPTMGASRHTTVQQIGSLSLQLEVWDIGNIERYSSLISMYLQHVASQSLLVLLVYDVCDIESFRRCVSLLKTLKSHPSQLTGKAPARRGTVGEVQAEMGTSIILVGNKLDQSFRREVKEEDIQGIGVPWCEISCKTGENVRKPLGIIAETINKLLERLNERNNSKTTRTNADSSTSKGSANENNNNNSNNSSMRRIQSEPSFDSDILPSQPPASSAVPASISSLPTHLGTDKPRRNSLSVETVQHQVFKCIERNPKTSQRVAVDITLTPLKIFIENQQQSGSTNTTSNLTTTTPPPSTSQPNTTPTTTTPSSSLSFFMSPVEGLFRFFSKREYNLTPGTEGKSWIRVIVDTAHPFRFEVLVRDASGSVEERLVFLCRHRDDMMASLKKLLPQSVQFVVGMNGISRADFVGTYREQCKQLRTSPLRAVEDLALIDEASAFASLDLSRSLRDHRQAHAVTEALRWNASIRSVDLSYNGLGTQGLGGLCRAVPFLTCLTSLDISNNSMGSEGGPMVATLIARSPHVERLLVDGNGFQDGCVQIASALAHNGTLKTLGLSHNAIDSDTAVGFARALAMNATLTSLDLSYNDIHEEAVGPLANALQCNTVLVRFAILGNASISDQSVASLTLPKTPEVLAMLEEKKEIALRGTISNYSSMFTVSGGGSGGSGSGSGVVSSAKSSGSSSSSESFYMDASYVSRSFTPPPPSSPSNSTV